MPNSSYAFRSLLLLLLLFSCGATAAFGQVAVLTQHNDNARTGANLNETTLNVSNVTVNQFGKLFSRTVDGQMYAQPLYVPNVSIPTKGVHNVVYVATMNNSVYAFDADDPNASTPLWTVNFGPPVPVQDTDELLDIQPIIGITSTPVIDTSTKTLYCVAKTKEGNSYFYRLHALDITTGQERTGSPVVITGSVSGTGDGSVGGTITFDTLHQLNRPSLLLLNGGIYIAFGSHGDQNQWHGWVFGYNASTLQRVSIFNTSPNGSKTSIWQSGQGLASDANGNIYFMTANGTFDVNTGGKNMGSCFVKLSSPALQLLDWFSPYNQDILNTGNHDLGSAGPLLIPGTNMLIGGGKEGRFYLLDRNNMGHFRAGNNNQILQSFQATAAANFLTGHIHGSPVYWNSPNLGPLIYVWGEVDVLKAYQQMATGLFNTTPVAIGPDVAPGGMPGAILSISANGSSSGSGVIWAYHPFSGDANPMTVPGILRAFDASNIAVELWNSKQNAARDDLGNFAKYTPPTIANGKVYLATFSNQLVVYGLNPPGTPPVISNGQPTGTLPLGTIQTTLSINTDKNATCRYSTTPGVSYDSMLDVFSTTGGTSHSTTVTGLTDGQVYNSYVRCSDTAGNANTSDYVISFGVGVVPPQRGLVAAYSFREGTGTTTSDASGNANTGALNGPTWSMQGKYGSALSFNGASRVTVNDAASLHLTNGMTLEAWVYPTSATAGWKDIIYKANDMYYLEGSSPQGGAPAMGGTFSPNLLYGTATLPINTWSHLAATYDGAAMLLFVNGVQVASFAQAGPIQTSTQALSIGGDAIYGQYWTGLIDEARIYNRALSPAEIQSDMSTPIGEALPSPDTTGPSVVISSPASNATVTSSPITVSGTASDSGLGNNGISSVTVNSVAATGGTATGSATANWSQSIALNSGANTITVVAKDNSTNQNPTTVSITITYSPGSGDTTPPVISNGQPVGTLPAGTTTTTLSLTTDENATCKYATTAGTAYAAMPNVFSTTGGTSHSTTVSGLVNGQTYTYYSRCSDALGNIDRSDYVITFSIAATAQAISFVQVAAATPQSPTQTVTIVTYPSVQTAGDLNIVVVGWNDTTATVQSVQDSRGNIYNLAIGPTTGTGLRQSIYYAKNIIGSSNAVTVTFSQPAAYPDIRILEYRGVTTLDVTKGASGSGSTANSGSGAATTTSANELIFGANTVATGTTGAGTGFTSRIITSPDGDIAEDRIVTTTGSYSTTAPLTGSKPWVMQMATFK